MRTALGRARDTVGGDATVMVMSDHGFAPFYWGVNLNSWLAEKGYIKLSDVENRDKYEFYGNAIAAYEEVLRIDPGDDDARWNLELALRKQAEYSTGGSPGRGGRAQAGAGDGTEQLDSEQEQAVGAMAGGGSGDAAGESAEELSTDEARRLLEQVEREQLSEHEARPARRGTRAERDW